MLWTLLTPVSLFFILMLLLYVPPVQDLIRREATSIVSEVTGLDVSVRRINLRFPLTLRINDVLVLQPIADSLLVSSENKLIPDTLLKLQSLEIRVQALPLFRGKLELDNVSLEQFFVNSGTLLEGMALRGDLGYFFLKSHGVDLVNEQIVLNNIELSDARLQVVLTDTTTTQPDTISTVLNWKVLLHALKLTNVAVDVQMPLDSLRLQTKLADATIQEAKADLGRQIYGWERFSLFASLLKFDSGHETMYVERTDSLGRRLPPYFNPSHLSLRDVRIGIDSVDYADRNMTAHIRECSFYERSGLTLSSLTGRLEADTSVVRIPLLRLLTPHSELTLTAHTYWELLDMPTTGHLSARLDARIGKQDMMLLGGDLPDAFKVSYPFHPLVIRAGTEGNLREMHISRLTADLPGAFSLNGGGEFYHLNNVTRRNGTLDFQLQTQNLGFMTALAELSPETSVVIPDSMNLSARLTLDGSQCTAKLDLREQQGTMFLQADYNLETEAYRADLSIDSLQIVHFLPHDSLYMLTATLSAQGQGLDVASPKTQTKIDASLKQLQYAHWDITDVGLRADLNSSVITARLHSDNKLLKMRGGINMRLDREYLDGWLNMNVAQVDLYELGVAPKPLEHPFSFTLGAEARRDSVKMHLLAGDLDLNFRARSTLKIMLEKGNEFITLLQQQIEDRRLNHVDLRRLMPSAGFYVKAGKDNPLSYYLATQDIAYDAVKLNFGLSPQRGINGRAAIYGFRMDSLQMDTIYFLTKQDTTQLRLQAGIVNAPGHPHAVFRTSLTGEVRNEDAELSLNYEDEQGNTGMLLGINARPLTEGNGKGNGLLLQLTPNEPIVAFQKFHFTDNRNWIYLHKNMRVYAGIEMESNDGLGFRMRSNQNDTVSLQNINVELSRFQLGELSKVMPYLPSLTGLLSIEANYVQTEKSLQVSAESVIDSLTYERQTVGDVGMGATWLPGGKGEHYLNTYFSVDNKEVLMADGMMRQQGENTFLDLNAMLEHLPLRMVNAFVPDQAASLTGNIDGELMVVGELTAPKLNGSLTMDSVSIFARQVGARYWFDNRPLQLVNNRLLFDKFAIYTTSDNPFTINGNVDFRRLNNPTADLTLSAKKYTLLDAPRTRESLAYGKIFVDLNASMRGPLDALVMRGNMNLLGNTNVTYVLTDSPLTVEDRLDGLVTFTSFRDTATVANKETPTMSLGGMDMIMTVHIDDAVRLRADLSPDRSKYIELEGGGDLNMQYTPQGDLSLTGRYTLSGGVMKYSLPIIPLKEFQLIPGSYVDWRGDLMNPTLDLKATERIRASVTDEGSDVARMVNFDASIIIKNRLSAPELAFDLSAPENANIENELQAMGAEERNKAAITMIATGMYLGSTTRKGGLNMSSALNSVIQSQINSLAGSVKNANISVGIEDRTSASTGSTEKDFSFRYSQRLFNDRVQIVIGGKVSTGSDATNNAESFIDNVSLEYRLDTSGTRYVRAFYNKNYESVLDGEITEAGIGLVLRRKMDRLSELFIFKKNK